MREEFELNGQDWDNRGNRLNEMIRALRVLWQPGWVEWHGDYYDIPEMMLGPAPTAPIPIYSGGHTEAALRRAARYCDGWIGNAYPWDEAAHYIGKLKDYLREYGRESEPFEIIVGFYEAEPRSLPPGRRGAGRHRHLCMPWAASIEGATGHSSTPSSTATRSAVSPTRSSPPTLLVSWSQTPEEARSGSLAWRPGSQTLGGAVDERGYAGSPFLRLRFRNRPRPEENFDESMSQLSRRGIRPGNRHPPQQPSAA